MKIAKRALALCLTVLCLAGCAAPWSTFTMEEIFPPAVDPFTWLTVVESVTVTRAADGASVTVSGTDVELLYAGFANAPCTRRSGDVVALYTLEFSVVESDADYPRIATVGEYRGDVCCAVGEYRYRPVTVLFDLSYIESLFG